MGQVVVEQREAQMSDTVERFCAGIVVLSVKE